MAGAASDVAFEAEAEPRSNLPAYGEQVPVFPVHLGDGSLVWMCARDDFPWIGRQIVWCDARRLKGFWRTAATQQLDRLTRWRPGQLETVERCFADSTRTPVPVAYAGVTYGRRREPWSGLLEAAGLYGLSTKPALGFVDGRHRTAWLIARGAPLVPIMTTSWWDLTNFAGARIAMIDLEGLDRRSRRPGPIQGVARLPGA